MLPYVKKIKKKAKYQNCENAECQFDVSSPLLVLKLELTSHLPKMAYYSREASLCRTKAVSMASRRK